MDLYNPIQLLGKGTFGYVLKHSITIFLFNLHFFRTVHLCERIHNKQKVVIKQINTYLEGEQLKAAKNEVAILKSLNHPNIIQYYHSFAKNTTFFIIMQYASKGSLYDLIAKSRPELFEPKVSSNHLKY